MSDLRWPAYTDPDILECLRLALESSPPAQPAEANWRCRRDEAPREPQAAEQETAVA